MRSPIIPTNKYVASTLQNLVVPRLKEEPCKREYHGTVFSGRGEGSFYVSIYAREFRRVLGFTPYPGTLNVKLDDDIVDEFNRCLERIPKHVIEPPRIEGAKLARVYAYPVRINGYSAWIVRPEITVYSRDVVEIIADKYLRKFFGLEDGDRVSLSFEM